MCTSPCRPRYVYWAETFGEIAEVGSIYRAPITGGARQLCFNLNQGGGGAVMLQALGNDGFTFGESIAYMRSSGRWARATEQLVLKGQPPSWPEVTIANSIDTFKVVGNRMYWMPRPRSAPLLSSARANCTRIGEYRHPRHVERRRITVRV